MHRGKQGQKKPRVGERSSSALAGMGGREQTLWAAQWGWSRQLPPQPRPRTPNSTETAFTGKLGSVLPKIFHISVLYYQLLRKTPSQPHNSRCHQQGRRSGGSGTPQCPHPHIPWCHHTAKSSMPSCHACRRCTKGAGYCFTNASNKLKYLEKSLSPCHSRQHPS